MYINEFYVDDAGEWRWRLKHQNGNIIMATTEGYSRKQDCYMAVKNAFIEQVEILITMADAFKMAQRPKEEDATGS